MEELARLFGVNAGIEDIVDVRVARMKMGGIVGAAIAGESPTELTVVLRDGRTLQARSRGPGPDEDAIEAFVRAASTAQAQLTLSAIAQGGRVPFGDAEVSFEGISYKGQLTPWESVGHWLVGQGYLFWKAVDGSEPKLWLGSTPFGDALVLVLANRIPDKDYRKIAATPEFQAAEAAKAKKTRTAIVVVLGVLALGAGGIYAADAYKSKKLREEFAREEQARIDGAFAAFAQNPTGLPTCGIAPPGKTTVLVASDRSSIRVYDTAKYQWRDSFSTTLHAGRDDRLDVWGSSGDETRVVGFDGEKKIAVCASRATVPAAVSSPQSVAEKLAGGWLPTPPPPATTSAPTVAPSASIAPPTPKTKKKKGR